PVDFHARFHATGRSYVYRLSLRKEPFRQHTVASLPRLAGVDREKMRAAAALLLDYAAFAPFCKTNSDAFTMNCELTASHWEFGDDEWTFHVSANRFLRGMVRLIVGMCLRVGEGKLSLEEVRRALDVQERLPRPWSAPAAGLYLSEVRYPNRAMWEEIGTFSR
ncbi:MAG: tRNA pseudouridine(38-40) synthase TruA, partial [Bacteroidota bacterium]